MTQMELEAKLSVLESEYIDAKTSTENLIRNIKNEMAELDAEYNKKINECKIRINNLQNNVADMKADYLRQKAVILNRTEE